MWNEERFQEAAGLAALGWSARLIAAQLGITRNAVIGKMHRHSIKLKGQRPARWHPAPGSPHGPWTEEMQATVKRLVAEGKSNREIGEEIGKRDESVRDWLRRHGLRNPNRAAYPRPGHRVVRGPRLVIGPNDAEVYDIAAPRVSLLEKGPTTCSWVIDDPKDPAPYCGHTRLKGSPYCHHHQTRGVAQRAA